MKYFSLRKYKIWCKKNHQQIDKWANSLDGMPVFDSRCYDDNNEVWYVSDEWCATKKD